MVVEGRALGSQLSGRKDFLNLKPPTSTPPSLCLSSFSMRAGTGRAPPHEGGRAGGVPSTSSIHSPRAQVMPLSPYHPLRLPKPPSRPHTSKMPNTQEGP